MNGWQPPAVSQGLDFFSLFSLELVFLGLALFAAVGALSYEEERPFSASIVYLGLGIAAAVAVHLFGVPWLDPFEDTAFFEHLAEIALVVALFASGLRIRRELGWRTWRNVLLLLGVVMPLTIAAVALFGVWAMGLPLGAAVVLGGALAPTDPVLAGGIGLGPPGEEGADDDVRFNLTAEASGNDALSGPFVLLGIFMLEREGSGWVLEWVLADLVYAVAVAIAIGAAAGHWTARLSERMRRREMLSRELTGFLIVGIVVLVYGVADTLDTYGFLAVFAAGIAFRRYEEGREYNREAHDSAQVAENFLELAVILVLGSVVTLDALEAPGAAGWLLAPLLILLVRPLLAGLVLQVTRVPARERLFLAGFGVKGVASLYYAAVVLEKGVLTTAQETLVFWTIAFVVIASIVAHGATADALTRRLLERR